MRYTFLLHERNVYFHFSEIYKRSRRAFRQASPAGEILYEKGGYSHEAFEFDRSQFSDP